jgi:hypothetical protein
MLFNRSAVLTDVYRNMGGFEPVPYVVKYKADENQLPAEHRRDQDDDDEDDEVQQINSVEKL